MELVGARCRVLVQSSEQRLHVGHVKLQISSRYLGPQRQIWDGLRFNGEPKKKEITTYTALKLAELDPLPERQIRRNKGIEIWEVVWRRYLVSSVAEDYFKRFAGRMSYLGLMIDESRIVRMINCVSAMGTSSRPSRLVSS